MWPVDRDLGASHGFPRERLPKTITKHHAPLWPLCLFRGLWEEKKGGVPRMQNACIRRGEKHTQLHSTAHHGRQVPLRFLSPLLFLAGTGFAKFKTEQCNLLEFLKIMRNLIVLSSSNNVNGQSSSMGLRQVQASANCRCGFRTSASAMKLRLS